MLPDSHRSEPDALTPPLPAERLFIFQGEFIDFATTAVEAAAVTYNPDLRRFVSTKVTFEHTAGGQIITSSKVQVLNVGLYEVGPGRCCPAPPRQHHAFYTLIS